MQLRYVNSDVFVEIDLPQTEPGVPAAGIDPTVAKFGELHSIASIFDWLGTAPLAAFLAAEERAQPLDDAAYDELKNSCIHYAQRISRDLGFPETKEIATFVTKNIVKAPGLVSLLQTHAKPGGHRILASLANHSKTLLESSITKIVLSQLEL